jgi:hypothetical protein
MTSETGWRKSSYSGGQGGNCIEVTDSQAGQVLVRDTKDRTGSMLRFTADAWQAFAKQLKSLASTNLGDPLGSPEGVVCFAIRRQLATAGNSLDRR